MTFRIGERQPSRYSTYEEWADYAECEALKHGTISALTLFKTETLVLDEIEVNGIESDSDFLDLKADEMICEINRRSRATNNRYPYSIDPNGYSITFQDVDSIDCWVYKFLLLTTRLNMSKYKVQNGIDGTKIFEELSAETLKFYLGERSQAQVFGTATLGGFSSKVSTLITKIGEGGRLKNNGSNRPQDDKLDVVVWQDFADKKSSKLIVFGQCKTGTSWHDDLSDLSPIDFCNAWLSDSPLVTPLKTFFCSQYFPNEIWSYKGFRAGVIFDRFRIMDYLPINLSGPLYESIKSWSKGAIQHL